MITDFFKHYFVPSIIGWIRFALSHPAHAVPLLALRAAFTLTRRIAGSWTDPFGLTVNTPEMLVSYWSIFIMGDLNHPSWISAIRTSGSPYVIDVGANAGVFVHYIHTLNGNAEMLAIEPQKRLVQQIENYCSNKELRIRGIAAACSDHEGTLPLYLNQDGDTSASLNPQYIVPHSRSVLVPLVTLDAIATPQRVCLLKIDAEGHDIAVLKGATHLLRRTRYLLLELHNSKDMPEVEGILGKSWSGIPLGTIDYLFINHNIGQENNANQVPEDTARVRQE